MTRKQSSVAQFPALMLIRHRISQMIHKVDGRDRETHEAIPMLMFIAKQTSARSASVQVVALTLSTGFQARSYARLDFWLTVERSRRASLLAGLLRALAARAGLGGHESTYPVSAPLRAYAATLSQ